MSQVRKEAIDAIEVWVEGLDHDKIERVLEVGIGGDPKPGGNYYLFRNKRYETMDDVGEFEPTYFCSIENPPDDLREAFDVVIMSQTLEHTKDPAMAVRGCWELLKRGGHLIIDCPWLVPYHADPSFGDYWRVSKDGMNLLLKDFEEKDIRMSEVLTTAIARKQERCGNR